MVLQLRGMKLTAINYFKEKSSCLDEDLNSALQLCALVWYPVHCPDILNEPDWKFPLLLDVRVHRTDCNVISSLHKVEIIYKLPLSLSGIMVLGGLKPAEHFLSVSYLSIFRLSSPGSDSHFFQVFNHVQIISSSSFPYSSSNGSAGIT